MTYDKSYILEKFRGLVGFMSSYDIANYEAEIDEALTQSESGSYINGLHPLFTPENLANCTDQFSNMTVRTWLIGTSYKKDTVVRHSGTVYRALRDNIGQAPDTHADDWQKTTLLSAYIRSVYDAAVLKVLERLSEQKSLDGYGKQLVGNTPLFASTGFSADIVEKIPGRFVGFEFNVQYSSVSTNIQRIGIQLTGPATVPLHIIYRGDDTVINLDYTSTRKEFKYFDLDIPSIMSLEGPALIGYYEDDLVSVNAIYLATNIFDADYCTTCGSVDSGARKVWSEYAEISPVTMIGDDVEQVTLTNFGLNPVLSFNCDWSDLLIRQKYILLSAFKAQLKVAFMEVLSSSMRVNSQSERISNLAFNIMQDFANPDNPIKALNRSIKALTFQFSGLHEKCVPCERKVSYRTRVI